MTYIKENFQVKAFSRDRTQVRFLPPQNVAGATWNDDRYGGYGAGNLNVQWSADGELTLQPGDCIEFYTGSTRRYRGWIRRANVSATDTRQVTYQLAGLASILGSTTIKRRYPGGFDIGVLIGKLANDTLSLPGNEAWPNLQISSESVGISCDGADFYNQEFTAALDGLMSQSANTVVWGFDVDDEGRDRFYVRPTDTAGSATHVVNLPLSTITESGCDTTFEDVVNRVQIESSKPPRYPNLIYNAGFEKPVLTGAGGSNLVRNGDFEQDDTYWTLTGGASIKSAGAIEGTPFSGSKMVELDSGDESLSYNSTPAEAIVVGNTYRFAFRAKREVASVGLATAGCAFTLQFSDGGVPISDPVYSSYLTDENGADIINTTSWKRFEWAAVAPPGADGIIISFDADDGLDAGDGILIDAIECYDTSAVYQDGWEVVANGSSTVLSVDWTAEDPHEGGYAVQVTGEADSSNEIYLAQKGGSRFGVIGGQTIRFSIKAKKKPDIACSDIRLYVQSWNSNQESLGIDFEDFADTELTEEWGHFEAVVALPQSAAYGFCWVAIRSNGTTMFDSFRASDSNYSAEAGGAIVYIPDGNYISPVFKASELFGPGGSGGDNSDPSDTYYNVYNSEAVYGVRTKLVQLPDITTTDAAQEWAIAYLKAAAVAGPAPSITLVDDGTVIRPGENVRLTGRNGRLLADEPLPIARLAYTFDGGTGLTASMQLQRELRDEAFLINQLIERAARRGAGAPQVPSLTASPVSNAGGSSSGFLETTGVTPGSYTLSSITVDVYGRLTAASTGTAPELFPDVYPTFVKPVSAGTSWVNQDSATIADTSAGVILQVPKKGTLSLAQRVKSVGTTFTYTLGYVPLLAYGQYPQCGICLRNNTNGKIIGWQETSSNSERSIEVVRYASSTAFEGSGTVPFTESHRFEGAVHWLRVRGDGTAYYFDISSDGVYWINRTQFLQNLTPFTSPADLIGFFGATRQTATPLLLHVIHDQLLNTFETANTFN